MTRTRTLSVALFALVAVPGNASAAAPSAVAPATAPSAPMVAPAPPAGPATALPAPPPPPTAPPPPTPEALDARLAAAKRRLEAAAREVAELSTSAGAGRADRLVFAGELPRRAILGLYVDPASGRDGARVLQVSPGGPAAAAGVRAGDVLLSIGGTGLRDRDDAAGAVVERMASVQPDEKLEIELLRDGRTRKLEVTPRRSPLAVAARGLGGRELPPLPALPPFEGPVAFEWRGDAPSVAGLELASMTAGLGRYFGTAQGVLVVRAPRQPQWQLEDGDVILAIDGREPTSGAHASRILRSYQAGEALKLRVMRQRKPLELRIAVPEPEALAAPRVNVVRMRRVEPGAEGPPAPGSDE